MSATIRRYLHDEGQFQVFTIDSTLIGQAAFQQLNCSPVAVQLLTRAMTAALLLTANIKSEGTLSLRFRGDGPLDHLTAEANTSGHVRGAIGNPSLVLDAEEGTLFQNAIGNGTLTVKRRTKATEGMYESVVEIVPGGIPYNIANYLYHSEQIASAIQLGARLHGELGVSGAGGVLIQAMPGASDDLLFILESRLQELPPLADFFQETNGQDSLRDELFGHIPVKQTGSHNLRYVCACNRQQMLQVLSTLPVAELQSLREEDKSQTIKCSYCNRGYPISVEDLDVLIDMKQNPA